MARATGRASRERVDVLLVDRGLCPTRARARARILAGDVVVGDHRVDKPGTLVPRDAAIRLRGEELPWVSRGGLKLVHALDHFRVEATGRVAIDVGASTGGFTQVLLSRGAPRVYAVDVGWGQLAHVLRQDPRVVVMERTHVKDLGALDPPPSLATVDVSFISLRLVLPHLARVLARPAEVVALVKPQFEAGREHVGKGGVVRDPAVREQCVKDICQFAETELGLALVTVVPSPILGPAGNQEFMVAMRTATRIE